MKRFLLSASLFLASSPACFAGDLKIAVIDMKRVFSEYYRTQDAERAVNEDKQAAKRDLDERSAKYNLLLEKFQALAAEIRDDALSDSVRAAKSKEADTVAAEAKSLEREIAEFRARRESQLQESVLRTRQAILEGISAVAEKKAKEGAYDLVFDKSGLSMNGVNFLLHSKDAVDISDELIAILNKDAPAAGKVGASSP